MEISQQVDEVLVVLSERFGTTVETLWGYMVSKNISEGWIMLSLGVLFGAIGIWVNRTMRARSHVAREAEKRDESEMWMVGCVIFSLGAMGACLGTSIPAALQIINAEFYALKDLVAMF